MYWSSVSGIAAIERTKFYLAALLLTSVGHVCFSNSLVTSCFVSQVLFFLSELDWDYKFSAKCEIAGNMKQLARKPMLPVMCHTNLLLLFLLRGGGGGVTPEFALKWTFSNFCIQNCIIYLGNKRRLF